MDDRRPKKPKHEDSTLDEQAVGIPTFWLEWDDGEGITALYSDGLTETHVREFCARLIERLKKPVN